MWLVCAARLRITSALSHRDRRSISQMSPRTRSTAEQEAVERRHPRTPSRQNVAELGAEADNQHLATVPAHVHSPTVNDFDGRSERESMNTAAAGLPVVQVVETRHLATS
jgi:hypothetical protein